MAEMFVSVSRDVIREYAVSYLGAAAESFNAHKKYVHTYENSDKNVLDRCLGAERDALSLLRFPEDTRLAVAVGIFDGEYREAKCNFRTAYLGRSQELLKHAQVVMLSWLRKRLLEVLRESLPGTMSVDPVLLPFTKSYALALRGNFLACGARRCGCAECEYYLAVRNDYYDGKFGPLPDEDALIE